MLAGVRLSRLPRIAVPLNMKVVDERTMIAGKNYSALGVPPLCGE